jgi:hypothetical protein
MTTILRANFYLVPCYILFNSSPSANQPPARGTLFPSRPEAVASKCLRWFALNLMLFLLPLLGGSLAMLTLGARLGIYGHKNPHQLAYMLTYFAICSGSANVFIGERVNIYSVTR